MKCFDVKLRVKNWFLNIYVYSLQAVHVKGHNIPASQINLVLNADMSEYHKP